MLYSTMLTSIILPMSLVLSSFLLLGHIWSNKRLNQSFSNDLGRAEAELEMVKYQVEFCKDVVKEKEMEILENKKHEEEVMKLWIKAKEDRKKLDNIKTTIVNNKLEETIIVKKETLESTKLLGKQIEHIKEQENNKHILDIENKKLQMGTHEKEV